jgi:hypothetical protein
MRGVPYTDEPYPIIKTGIVANRRHKTRSSQILPIDSPQEHKFTFVATAPKVGVKKERGTE